MPYRFTPISDGQCNVTLYQRLNGGTFKRSMPLRDLVEMRVKFQRDEEIDLADTNDLAALIR